MLSNGSAITTADFRALKFDKVVLESVVAVANFDLSTLFFGCSNAFTLL